MKVVSMVPSWTETLIAAGIQVVGRTRYCLHPVDAVADIPIVGGTKGWNWDKIRSLRPDLILLDQEENPKFMSEQTDIPFIVTHVTSVKDMPQALRLIESHIPNGFLRTLVKEWSEVKPYQGEIPGIVQWGRLSTVTPQNIYYVIWKDPWMVVSRDTFVGSMLEYCGIQIPQLPEKYPKLDLAQLRDKQNTLLLFSTEPYPFLQRQSGLAELGCAYAFIDGEKFSWFGVRSLRFLQHL